MHGIETRSKPHRAWIGLAAAGLIALALALSACGGDSDGDGGDGADTRDYPADVREEFLDTCQKDGGGRERCECSLEKLEEKFTLEESAAVSEADGREAARDCPYPPTVRKNFVDSCVETGGDRERCACLLDKLEERYSLEEFAELDARLAEAGGRASGSEQTPKEIEDAAKDC